jgi:ABC-2 type transport system permease protein
MKKFIKLIKREFKQFLKNPVAVIVFFGGPLIFGLAIGFVYLKGDVSELPVSIIDKDHSALSAKIIDAINDNEYSKVVAVYAFEKDARKDFINGNIEAVVTIPERFQADVLQKRYPEIQVDMNTANILTGNYLSKAITASLQTINAGVEVESIMKKGTPNSIAMTQFESFKVNYDRYYNPLANYLQFLWPGIICTILQQVLLLVIALVFSREFEKKTIYGLLRYSRSPLLLMITKLIPYLLMGSIMWYGILYGMFPFFKVPIHAGFLDLFIFSELFLVCLIFFGIMVSVIFPSQLMSTEVLMIIAAPSFILSGYTWPVSQMPEAIRWVAESIPLTHFVEGFRKLAYMEATLGDLMPQIKGLAIISVVSAGVSWVVLRMKITAVLKRRQLAKVMFPIHKLKKISKQTAE